MGKFLGGLAAALMLVGMGQAHADASLSAAFRDPVGTVAATDSIPVWITLTSTGDEAFTFDESAGPDTRFGLPDSVLLPNFGTNFSGTPFSAAFDSYVSVNRFSFRVCDDNFTNVCQDGAYTVQGASGPGSWFNLGRSFALNPGESIDLLIHVYAPVGGAAPAGTYTATNMGFGLTVHGFDAQGNELEAEVFSVRPCDFGSPSTCGFTRNVVAVPEPGSALLLLAGLAPLMLARARRARKA